MMLDTGALQMPTSDKVLYNALERLNYRISKMRRDMPGLTGDIEPYLSINFGDGNITKSGRISRKILKNPDADLLSQIEGAIDFINGMRSDFINIPENIYDIWQGAISDYYRFVSEIGAEALRDLAPETSQNVRALTKGDTNPDFWRAVNTWERERQKVMEYVESLMSAEPFTDY